LWIDDPFKRAVPLIKLVGTVVEWLLCERQPMVTEEKLLLLNWIGASEFLLVNFAEMLFGQLIPVICAHYIYDSPIKKFDSF
jgi:hypothetical protein